MSVACALSVAIGALYECLWILSPKVGIKGPVRNTMPELMLHCGPYHVAWVVGNVVVGRDQGH